MYAIVASYRGPSNARGSRFLVRFGDRHAVTVPYDYSAPDAGRAAILRALSGPLSAVIETDGYGITFGTLPNGDTVGVVGILSEGRGYVTAERFPDPDHAHYVPEPVDQSGADAGRCGKCRARIRWDDTREVWRPDWRKPSDGRP